MCSEHQTPIPTTTCINPIIKHGKERRKHARAQTTGQQEQSPAGARARAPGEGENTLCGVSTWVACSRGSGAYQGLRGWGCGAGTPLPPQPSGPPVPGLLAEGVRVPSVAARARAGLVAGQLARALPPRRRLHAPSPSHSHSLAGAGIACRRPEGRARTTDGPTV